MAGLSKSKYTNFRKCRKCLWLGTYKPEKQVIDDSVQARFDAGTNVGELAKGLLGAYTDVSTTTSDGYLDFWEMLTRTQQCVLDGCENICEAAFSYESTATRPTAAASWTIVKAR